MRKLHAMISLAIAIAVPAAIYGMNGEIALEFIVLGAIMGFAWWYWGPTGAPL